MSRKVFSTADPYPGEPCGWTGFTGETRCTHYNSGTRFEKERRRKRREKNTWQFSSVACHSSTECGWDGQINAPPTVNKSNKTRSGWDGRKEHHDLIRTSSHQAQKDLNALQLAEGARIGPGHQGFRVSSGEIAVHFGTILGWHAAATLAPFRLPWALVNTMHQNWGLLDPWKQSKAAKPTLEP